MTLSSRLSRCFRSRRFIAGASLVVLLFVLFVSVSPALAATTSCKPGGVSSLVRGYWGPLISCTALGGSGSCPACVSVCDILQTGQNFIFFGMTLLLFVLTPVMIVVGGVTILLSAGSSSMVSKGRGMIWGAVIGLAIGLGAFVIINTFLYLMGGSRILNPQGKKGVAWPNIQCTPIK